MRLSVVIISHNRPDALHRTLTMLRDNPHLPHDEMELLVVDNGSTPPLALPPSPGLRVIRRRRNEGVSARNHGFAVAVGEYLMLCDDDSYPLGDAATRAMAYLDAHPRTAAVVGRAILPDGRREASAFPTVTINCAVVIRRRVVEEVGPLPREFFRQAEEYDWSFRIWQAGHRIERFEDLVWRHDKAPGNRAAARVHHLDMRNNRIVLERYLPRPLRIEYRRDWTRRYAALARADGCRWASVRGRVAGWAWAIRTIGRRRTLDPRTIECIFDLEGQRRRIDAWATQRRVGRVLIADLGKNIYATWRGCREAGLTVLGVAENAPAFAGLNYRRLPVRPDAHWRDATFDGIVLSNINPAQVEARAAALRETFSAPVLALWRPRTLGRIRDSRCTSHAPVSAVHPTPSPL